MLKHCNKRTQRLFKNSKAIQNRPVVPCMPKMLLVVIPPFEDRPPKWFWVFLEVCKFNVAWCMTCNCFLQSCPGWHEDLLPLGPVAFPKSLHTLKAHKMCNTKASEYRTEIHTQWQLVAEKCPVDKYPVGPASPWQQGSIAELVSVSVHQNDQDPNRVDALIPLDSPEDVTKLASQVAP